MRRTALLLALAGLAGCQKSGGPEDRTLAKLQQEVAREQQQKERAPLAEVVEDPNAGARQELPLPSQPEALAGPVRFQLLGLTTTRAVTHGRITLSTADRFLLVKLAVENGSAKDVTLGLGGTQLRSPPGQVGLSPDAQQAAGSRLLDLTLAGQERREVTLVFEVAPRVLEDHPRLALPGPGGGEALLSLR